MFASFLITFREGLEAFLLVGIILSYLQKMEARHYQKLIYAGVGLGFLGSLLTAVAFQFLVDEFDSETYQHYMMIGILLFAVAVLTYMMIWMKDQAKQAMGSLEADLRDLVDSKNLTGLVGLAFLAILREGWETVLFFSALMMQNDGEFTLSGAVIGAILGILASWALTALLMRGGRKLPIAAFFQYTSLLILLIAAGLLSSAVNLIQTVEWLPVLVPKLFDISFVLDDRSEIGTFFRALFGYNSSPTLTQFVLWSLYLATSLWLWKRTYATAR